MTILLGRIGLALAIGVSASSGAWAGSNLGRSLQASITAGEIVEQRKDVDEVTRPQPPSGPATPVPYCSPGSPICP